MAAVSDDRVCSLDDLYANGFNYPVPRELLEACFDGIAYDHNIRYSEEERGKLERDINGIYDKVREGAQRGENYPTLTLTAGSPGTGKTTVIRRVLQQEGTRAAYICPDDVCLNNMSLTYGAELKAGLDGIARTGSPSVEETRVAEKSLRQNLYTKWRPGSNAATHMILANLIKEKYDIFFGTTASHPSTANLLQFFKEQGYKIRILHVSAPDDVRWGSIAKRDEVFVQTTEKDVIQKGQLVPQRIQDTYLKFADTIEFYHRAAVDEDAVLAATWMRGTPPECPVLFLSSYDRYTKITKLHNDVCKQLNRTDILWSKFF